jgi:hypothetical protein
MPVYRNTGYSFGFTDVRAHTLNIPKYSHTRSVVAQETLITTFHNNEAHGVKDGDTNNEEHHRRSIENT